MHRVAVVSVRWGDAIIAVRGLARGEAARVGPRLISIPDELIAEGTVLAHVDRDGRAIGSVPAGATGRKVRADGTTQVVRGPRRVFVEADETLAIALGDASAIDGSAGAIELRLEVAAVPADAVASVRASSCGIASGARQHVLAAALAHALALALASQSALAADPEAMDGERIHELQRSLARIDERTEAARAREEEADGTGHGEGRSRARGDGLRPTSRASGGSARQAAPSRPSAGASGALRPPDHDPMAIGVPLEPEPPAASRGPAGVARMVEGELRVSGGARPEMIGRVVRQSASRLRACYEAGLARDPSLEGSLAIDAVISAGAVAAVRDAGSTLADAEVVRCGSRAIAHLSFPMLPEDGRVALRHVVHLSSGR